MNNPFYEVRALVEQARETQKAVANQSHSMALLLRGNLRHVGVYTLIELKRELRDFDAHTKKWKSK